MELSDLSASLWLGADENEKDWTLLSSLWRCETLGIPRDTHSSAWMHELLPSESLCLPLTHLITLAPAAKGDELPTSPDCG